MPEALDELLRDLRIAVDRGLDMSPLTDEIEALVEDNPDGSRAAVYAFDGDEMIRLWAIGLLGDPRNFDTLTAALAIPTSGSRRWRHSPTSRTQAGSTM